MELLLRQDLLRGHQDLLLQLLDLLVPPLNLVLLWRQYLQGHHVQVQLFKRDHQDLLALHNLHNLLDLHHQYLQQDPCHQHQHN